MYSVFRTAVFKRESTDTTNPSSYRCYRKEEVISCTDYRRPVHMRETRAPGKLTRFLELRELAARRIHASSPLEKGRIARP
jgi:hypothetical protein